jgi:hypothetical protein
VAHGVTSGNIGTSRSHFGERTWGRSDWFRNMNEETASLSLKKCGEEVRGFMVSEALEVTMNTSQIYCILLRILWLQVSGRGENILGFGERGFGNVAFLNVNGPSSFTGAWRLPIIGANI